MKAFVFVLLTLFGFSTSFASVAAKPVAHQKRFFLQANIGFEQIYYRCNEVEFQIGTFLRRLGAWNIQVSCLGGSYQPPPAPAWDATVTVSYQNLHPASETDTPKIEADWASVHFNSFDNCHVYAQTFQQVRSSFVIQDIWEPQYCFQPNSNFYMKMTTLIAK